MNSCPLSRQRVMSELVSELIESLGGLPSLSERHDELLFPIQSRFQPMRCPKIDSSTVRLG